MTSVSSMTGNFLAGNLLTSVTSAVCWVLGSGMTAQPPMSLSEACGRGRERPELVYVQLVYKWCTIAQNWSASGLQLVYKWSAHGLVWIFSTNIGLQLVYTWSTTGLQVVYTAFYGSGNLELPPTTTNTVQSWPTALSMIIAE